MAEILLYHHAQGQTPGFIAFADQLRADGHTVHTPDLYDGNTFGTIDDGVGYAKEVGFDTILERGRLAAKGLPDELVYAGFSLGVMPAQIGATWPPGVPLQIHMMEADEWVVGEDLDAARELERTIESAELFLYPGDRHLFADSSLSDYDEVAAALLMERVLAFLRDID